MKQDNMGMAASIESRVPFRSRAGGICFQHSAVVASRRVRGEANSQEGGRGPASKLYPLPHEARLSDSLEWLAQWTSTECNQRLVSRAPLGRSRTVET